MNKTKHKPFIEPPPALGSRHFARRFERWWQRKCAHHHIEPKLAMDTMLNLRKCPLEGLAWEYGLKLPALSPGDRKVLEVSVFKERVLKEEVPA
jgi:hypothetical protein